MRAPFVYAKRCYLFFLAAFFAFFFVAMVSILPSICHGTLRHHFIAICSLYRVNEKNSQEKNACANVYLSDARVCLTSPRPGVFVLSAPFIGAANLEHAPKPHEYWRFRHPQMLWHWSRRFSRAASKRMRQAIRQIALPKKIAKLRIERIKVERFMIR